MFRFLPRPAQTPPAAGASFQHMASIEAACDQAEVILLLIEWPEIVPV